MLNIFKKIKDFFFRRLGSGSPKPAERLEDKQTFYSAQPEPVKDFEDEQADSLTDFCSKASYFQTSDQNLISVISNPGALGEFQLCAELDKLTIDKRILVNLYLPNKGSGTTEIDVICITQGGIFVIENKNYSGRIYGKEQYKNWIYYPHSNMKEPISFYSPILQNQAHIKALKFNFPHLGDNLFHSLIVFSNRCVLNCSSKSVPVLHRSEICRFIERVTKENNALAPKEMERLYQSLVAFCRASSDVKEKHIDYVKSLQH